MVYEKRCVIMLKHIFLISESKITVYRVDVKKFSTSVIY